MKTEEWGDCPDCGVDIGKLHEPGCDVARCKQHGVQWLQHDKCDLTLWRGHWPGDEECIEWGWYTPTGQPDLNRLSMMNMGGWLRWDVSRERFISRIELPN